MQRVSKRRPLRSAADITQEELSSCFHLPSEVACKKLGIGLTVLKRQCRKFGIKRWPFRKMKSLDRLITNVQAGISPGDQNRVLVKSVEELEEQKRRMEECQVLDLDDNTKRLPQASKANHKARRMAQRPEMSGMEALGARQRLQAWVPPWRAPPPPVHVGNGNTKAAAAAMRAGTPRRTTCWRRPPKRFRSSYCKVSRRRFRDHSRRVGRQSGQHGRGGLPRRPMSGQDDSNSPALRRATNRHRSPARGYQRQQSASARERSRARHHPRSVGSRGGARDGGAGRKQRVIDRSGELGNEARRR